MRLALRSLPSWPTRSTAPPSPLELFPLLASQEQAEPVEQEESELPEQAVSPAQEALRPEASVPEELPLLEEVQELEASLAWTEALSPPSLQPQPQPPSEEEDAMEALTAPMMTPSFPPLDWLAQEPQPPRLARPQPPRPSRHSRSNPSL